MSAAGRQKLWERDAMERNGRKADAALRSANNIAAAVKARRQKLAEAFPAAPIRNRPAFTKEFGHWCVLRINDDGRREVYRSNLSATAAEQLAGQMRDRSTDAEVGEGWNYLPRRSGAIDPGKGGARHR